MIMKNKESQLKDGIENAYNMLRNARNSNDKSKIKDYLGLARLRIDIAIDNL